MSGYKYDDEGGQFFTFALTAVVAFLVPYTYKTLFSRVRSVAHGWLDRRGHKTRTAQRLMRTSWVRTAAKGAVLVAGWALVAYLVRRIATAAKNSTHAVYDPFAILGIAASATEKEIRRRYRKLSVQFHPDKLRNVANQTKEEIDAHYIELTKAYKSLTDETIRKNLDRVVIDVADNGCGIDPKDAEHIFERFYRADSSRNRATGGSGLGLAITKSLIEAHGGTVKVATAPGEGSTFTISLPAL